MPTPNFDHVDDIEPQDGISKAYAELVRMATQAYWVAPINTDNGEFLRQWYVADTAMSGKVHYQQR